MNIFYTMIKTKAWIPLWVFLCLGPVVMAQQTVTGAVKSDEGEALIGVNVVVKGTTIGTITDLEGTYKLEVPGPDATLVFSSVGFVSEEIQVGNQNVIDVALTADVKALQEIVVIGYGTQEKKDLAGAISTISTKDFERIPATNPLQAFQGKTPGLQITSQSGLPGSEASVLIRGTQSINGTNAPIYVVDGVITTGIDNISTNDIESVSVLKDASAAAIYGARAANGVIIVNTKRGKGSEKPEITLDSYVGVQTQSNRRLHVLNAQQYVDMWTEAYENAGIMPGTPSFPWTDDDLKYYQGVDTDWQAAMRQTGVLQNYNLGLSGGSDKSNYYISAGYLDQKGMVIETNYRKFTLHINSDHQINDWIRFGNSLNINSSTTEGSSAPYNLAAIKAPITRIYDETGDYAPIHNTALEHLHQNPVWQAKEIVDQSQDKNILGNLYLTIKILDGLDFTARGNLEWRQTNLTDFTPGLDPKYQWEGSTKNLIRKESQQNIHWTSDFLLNYKKTFGQNHVISALLGYSREENVYENLWGSRSDTPNNTIQYLDAGDPLSQLNGNGTSDWAFASIFGRLNYSFKDKYLFTGTVRRDGTSRLSSGNRYGVFPSASVAWRMSEENFLKNASFVNDLKIRASVGSLGNVLSISNYGTIASLDQWNYVLNEAPAQGYTLASAVNQDLKWESTTKKDIGIDATLFNNRLYTTMDYFIEDTYDLLFKQPIAPSTGLSGSPFINAGQVRNTGFEMLLGYRKTTGDWTYDVSANLSHVSNKVIDLGGRDLRTSGIVEGYPVNSFFGYEANGLIRTQDDLDNYPHYSGKQIGDIWLKDINGSDENGLVAGTPDGSVNADDRTLIGKKYPDFYYGVVGSLGYKNWTLQVQLQGVQGVDKNYLGAYNGVLHYFTRWAMNSDVLVLDRYNATKNPNGTMPRVSTADTGHNRDFSSFWLDDASYLRIRNVNLNYNFSDQVCKALGMGRLGVYASIDNFYTFSGFQGPEVDTTYGGSSGEPSSAEDPNVEIPQPRTWTFGLKATF